jgi:hypothetical protein
MSEDKLCANFRCQGEDLNFLRPLEIYKNIFKNNHSFDLFHIFNVI